MTLIADSSYVKNDPSKLAHNTYKKRDADYSGLVLYFTPRGEYVNGYRYKNGKLINTKRKIAGGVVTNDAPVEGGCWYYYMVQYGPDGSAINYRYMYTICEPAGGYGGGGGSGEGVPPPCPGQSPTGPTSFRGGNAVNSEPVEGGDPGDGGGFPVPAPCGAPAIIEHKEEIINKITDPCLNNTISEALTSNKDVKGFLADVINRYAGKNNKIIINLNNGNINFPAQTTSNFDDKTEVFSANITFKNGYYDDVSKEAVVASLVHEVVHAYLLETNSQYKSLPESDQHNFIFQNFVKDIAGYLQTKYNMPSENAWGLAWSGFGDVYNSAADNTTFATDPGSSMTKQQIAAATTPYNYVGNGSKGTPNCPPK